MFSKHNLVHTFKFDICGEKSSSCTLNKHKYTHKWAKLFSCDICNKSFYLHIEEHTKEKYSTFVMFVRLDFLLSFIWRYIEEHIQERSLLYVIFVKWGFLDVTFWININKDIPKKDIMHFYFLKREFPQTVVWWSITQLFINEHVTNWYYSTQITVCFKGHIVSVKDKKLISDMIPNL